MAFHGQGVLVFAADAPLGGNVLGGQTHVDVLKGVVECTDHHVDHFAVAHADTPAHVEAGVGGTTHVFGTTANSNIGITQQDGLAGRHNGL